MTKPTRPDDLDYQKYTCGDDAPFADLPKHWHVNADQLDEVLEDLVSAEAFNRAVRDIHMEAKEVSGRLFIQEGITHHLQPQVEKLTKAGEHINQTLMGHLDLIGRLNQAHKSLEIAQKTEHDACSARIDQLDVARGNTFVRLAAAEQKVGELDEKLEALAAVAEDEEAEALQEIAAVGRRVDSAGELLSRHAERLQVVEHAIVGGSEKANVRVGAIETSVHEIMQGLASISRREAALNDRCNGFENTFRAQERAAKAREKPTRIRAALYRLTAAFTDILLDAIVGEHNMEEVCDE
jgi:hypothetical protein